MPKGKSEGFQNSFFCVYIRDQYDTKVKQVRECQNVKVMLYLLEIRKEHSNCNVLHFTSDTYGIFTSKKTGKFQRVSCIDICCQHKIFLKNIRLYPEILLKQSLHSAVRSFHLGEIWRFNLTI